MCVVCTRVGKSSVLKSLGGVSSVLSNIILATSPHSSGSTSSAAAQKISNKEDAIVMDTKLKIIEILQVSQMSRLQKYFQIVNNIDIYSPLRVSNDVIIP